MSAFFEPLDSDHRVLPRQQTRVASFLISAHGALARQYALALPSKFVSAWQTELNAQIFRETEMVSLLLRATSWEPDLTLGYMAMSWELAWIPIPVDGIADPALAMTAGLATLAHAIHAGIRPAALIPVDASATDPFVMALRRIEFESGHLLQAQILLLKSADLVPFRDAVSTALEKRHAQIGRLWGDALAGIGITVAPRND
jgi:hypothetical protein